MAQEVDNVFYVESHTNFKDIYIAFEMNPHIWNKRFATLSEEESRG